MFRFLFEVFMGPVAEFKDSVRSGGTFFGMSLVMIGIYLVVPFGPIVVLGLLSKSVDLLVVGIGGPIFLGFSSVDYWLTRLQQQVRNETIRGKELDKKIEGE